MTSVATSWAEISARFLATDWGFESESANRDFHPYPAKFIPAIPRAAIAAVQLPVRSTVLDPFCGSGTTLAEAMASGHSAIGGDINPIAVLISRVRCAEWGAVDDERAREVSQRLQAAALESDAISEHVAGIPKVDHWFSADAQRALSGAFLVADAIDPDDPWFAFARAAISSVVVRVSNQDSDTRYAAVAKRGDQVSMARLLGEAPVKLADWKRAQPDHPDDVSFRVRESEAAQQTDVDDASVDLACFSPPYPNAYEYWLYHKYRMYLLGHDPIGVRTAEIGARPHYSRANGHDETDFARQMGEVFVEMGRVLRPGGAMVMVVGDSQIGGRFVDNGLLLSDVAERSGFSTQAAATRRIAGRRSSFNRSHALARTHEHVLLYRSEA